MLILDQIESNASNILKITLLDAITGLSNYKTK